MLLRFCARFALSPPVALLVCCIPLFGQNAVVSGRVFDPARPAVPEARLMLRTTATAAGSSTEITGMAKVSLCRTVNPMLMPGPVSQKRR